MNPPQRIPAGRERIFAQLDAIILIDSENDSSESAWRDALRKHGLEDRIAAVLISRNPDKDPQLTVNFDGYLWRGSASGLSRDRSPETIEELFRPALSYFWPSLVDNARRTAHARQQRASIEQNRS